MDHRSPSEEELKYLQDFIFESSERLALKSKLLSENSAIIGRWPDESFFIKKDSTLKKNTAFVKKVRNFADSQKEGLLVEFEALNLSKYVEEVSTAIVDAKIKTTDIPFILKLCSAMHQRYTDFGTLFLESWKKVFSSYKDSKQPNLSKLRVDLVLFAELITIGIFRQSEGIRQLASQLTSLTNGDVETFSNIGIVCSFCKHCSDDWIGAIPRRIKTLLEKYNMKVPRSTFLPAERKSKCQALFSDYLSSALRHLQRLIKDSTKVVSSNRELMKARGEVSDERVEKAKQLMAGCRKFHESLCVLADLLDADPPADLNTMFREDSKLTDINTSEPDKDDSQVRSQLFEDEDTRLFYESLPDIKAMVPGILYKESEQAKTNQVSGKAEDSDAQTNEDIDLETVESELAQEEALFKTMDENFSADSTGSQQADRSKPPVIPSIDDAEEDPSSSGKVLMETFLTQLPNCISRDLIDRAAIDFCLNLNKRSNRKRLVRALYSVPRTRYDLLPFYARLVAALAPVMPDLVTDLNSLLVNEFKWRVSKRDQMNLESKLKVVRFIGELVKFRIFSAHQALTCLKQLLPQFVHHNIDMACALLDTCGRFLYRLPSSHQRTQIYLEVMLRKKIAMHMDQSYSVMIENTYYYCNPPPLTRQALDAVVLTPSMQYLRRLLWRDVDRTTVNSVLRSFRKMDWNDSELVQFVEVLFTHAWEVPFTKINCIASVLSGLVAFHHDFAMAVVDNVIEDIRVGMELNLPMHSQRRISMVKYLGLLYIYCLIDSPVVFKTLYSLLTFGVSLDSSIISPLDPPDSVFRITLICTLLETLGGFFDRGKKRRTLNVFLIYFMRYYWFKRSQPFWIQSTSTDQKNEADGNNSTVETETIAPDSNGIRSTENSSDMLQTTSVDVAGLHSTTPSEPPMGFSVISPVTFSAAVEQHYTETLGLLRFNAGLAKNFEEAQKLVTRLEARYLPRLAGLNASFGLSTAATSDVTTEDGKNAPRGVRPDAPGRLDAIAEEEDLLLEGCMYANEDADDDDYEDEDDPEEDEGHRAGEDDENRSRRRMPSDLKLNGEEVFDNLQDPNDVNDLSMDPGSKHVETYDSGDDELYNADSEDERLIKVGLKPKFIDCPEDLEFRKALDRMTAEALLSTGSGNTPVGSSTGIVGVAADAMAGRLPAGPVLPAPDTLHLLATRSRGTGGQGLDSGTAYKTPNVFAPNSTSPLPTMQTKSDEENLQPLFTEQTREPSANPEQQKDTVSFNLIVRRGNRPYLLPLAVPETVQFAARYRQAEAAEREEKARMKQLVLEMHEAQKEEEMEWGYLGNSDAVLAYQFPINVNRDRWIKYNHPKGAPDADAVFGGSSQRH